MTLIRVVDTETTGVDDPAEIVELGWTDIVGSPDDGWEISDEPQSLLVNPGMPITFPAMATHHISQSEAETGIAPEQARRIAAEDADYLCAHNWAFDQRFLRADLPAICTYKCARTAWPDLQGYGNGSIRYERGLCPDDMRTQPAHRAGPDTWVTAHILLDLLQTYSVEQLVEISSNPVRLTKMPFGKHFGLAFRELPTDYLQWIVHKSDMARDPAKEDVVFSARTELEERASQT